MQSRPTTNQHEHRVHAPPEAVIVPILLVTMFVLLGAWLIAFEHVPSRVFYDQELYHRPAIDQFVRQWPDFDFWHYLSATTPGYHVLMAGVARFISPSIFALQIASLTIGAALIWTLSRAVARRTAGPLAAALCLPFMFSPYVVGSGAWLLPDDLAWLGVLLILLIALRPRMTRKDMVLGGAILLALVFVRQIQLWTAGLLWMAAWLAPQERPADGPAPQTLGKALASDLKSQTSGGLLCFLCTLPAIALFGLFFRYWGGPVPPVFQQWFHTYNAAAGAFILALFGAWGLFFSPIWAPHLLRFWRTRRAWLLAVVGAGVALVLLLPTNPDYASGRRTGLWNIAERLPVMAHHTSPVVAGLAMLGVVTVAALAFAAPMRQRLIFLAAIAGFALANTTNNDLFQRYVDPFVLMLLALMSATAAPAAKVITDATDGPSTTTYKAPARSRLQALGPWILALFLAAWTMHSTIRRDAEGKPDYAMIHDPPPPSRSLSAHDDPSKPASKPPPCDLPPPPKPPGKHFWPWA
jgi:hypothetical protein